MTTLTRSAAATLALAAFLGCDKSQPPSPETSATGASVAPTDTNKGTVRVSGSSALQPLVNAAKEKYETKNKGASIEVTAGGSKKGLTDAASGAVHVGDSDIFAPDDLKAQLVDHKVAVVGFAAMANKGPFNEKVTSVSLDQLAKIFTGTIKDWKDLGGTAQPIAIINRAPASGTRTVFGNIVLGGDKFVESSTEDNSGALVAKLEQTKGAISYLALSFKKDSLLTLSLKTDAGVVDPTTPNITSGAYPIWSYEHMYTKGEAAGPAKAFLDYVTSAEFQTGVLPNVPGFIPVVQMKVSRDKD
jgi:phosphate transport system substrate-binding protein